MFIIQISSRLGESEGISYSHCVQRDMPELKPWDVRRTIMEAYGDSRLIYCIHQVSDNAVSMVKRFPWNHACCILIICFQMILGHPVGLDETETVLVAVESLLMA